MKPVRLDVIAPLFEGLGLCTACELVLSEAGVGQPPAVRAWDEYPQDWQDDQRRLTEWVTELVGRYGSRLAIHLIDPQSPQGLLKSVRHRVRRYPTFVVAGRQKIAGWHKAELDAALGAALAAQGED